MNDYTQYAICKITSNMQRSSTVYLDQVLFLLEESKKRVPEKLVEDEDPFIASILNKTLEEMQAPKAIETWLGVPESRLPSAGLLTDFQLGLLVDKIVEVWKTFHFIPDFPHEYLSNAFKYKLLKAFWQEEVMYVSDDFELIDFCSGHPNDCPKGRICSCWKAWRDMKD